MTQPTEIEIPKTQQKWTTTSNKLHLDQYSPLPFSASSLPSTSLLIRISYAALNPVDLFILNQIPSWLPWRRNPIPCFDFSGTIVSVGSSVPSQFSVGVRVAGALGIKQIWFGKGTLVEYLEVGYEMVCGLPEGMGMREGVGGFGIAGQTAVEMVGRAGDIRGRRVLVYGASGGVGGFLTQVCVGLGAERVWGICSGGNRRLVEGFGAEVIDYTQHKYIEEHLAQKFANDKLDIVFECAENHNTLFSKAEGFLKKDGKFISVVGGWSQGVVPFVMNKLTPVVFGGVSRNYEIFLLSASGKIANKVKECVERGVIKEFPVDSEFEMGEVVKAFERLATGRARGKVIARIGGEEL
ncbi:hypothetical protein QBC38DRAFT_60306 [Podospora fimiseda]|uniref:Enoyl reductase (ER) domain-containing protein n=1 Tax=Podospora fimiseda TaxID=252190 RepID=A0AAN6YR14_9PEZI|nr:hypothetical protein QBC38DRAFT_60306 [Podospora fimiseda]